MGTERLANKQKREWLQFEQTIVLRRVHICVEVSEESLVIEKLVSSLLEPDFGGVSGVVEQVTVASSQVLLVSPDLETIGSDKLCSGN